MSQRRRKDRSHWGDAAFKAMHDKPITREVAELEKVRDDALVAHAENEASHLRAELERLRKALDAWKHTPSLPDCLACSVLDTHDALRGGK